MTGIQSVTNPSLKAFFGDRLSIYSIPEYQREYSWKVTGDAEVEVLWSDLEDYIKESPIQNYFMGPVLLYEDVNERNDFLKYSIVDGQQRLATLSILCAAFRDAYLFYAEQFGTGDVLTTSDSELVSELRIHAKNIQKQFILKKFTDNNDRELYQKTLTLTDENGDESCFSQLRFFDGRANNRDEWYPSARHNHRIVSAYNYLRFKKIEDHITEKGFSKEETKEFLDKWYEVLMEKLEFIVIKINNLTNSFKLFETINTRGRPLTSADLIKNLLYSRATEIDGRNNGAVTGSVKGIWKDGTDSIRSIIGKDSSEISRFLLRFWNSTTIEDSKTTKKKLFDQFQDHIRDLEKDDFLEFLDTMVEHAKYYVEIKDPTPPQGNSARIEHEIYASLRNLNRLNIAQHIPLLMAAMDNSAGVGRAGLKRILNLIETIFMRWNVAQGGSPSKIENYLVEWAKKLRSEGSQYIDMMTHVAKEVVDCPDELFILRMKNRKLTQTGRIKYFFRKIEMEMVGDGEIDYLGDDSMIDVEHILPQKSKSVAAWNVDFDEADKELYLDRIGNLTLLFKPDNIAISNSPFSEKRKTYVSSQLEITKGEDNPCSVRNHDYWAKRDIDKRQTALAELAANIWTFE